MSDTLFDNRIAVALSGGVDSTVCARLLMEQGYEVAAAVLNLSPAHGDTVEAARRSANQLGVPLSVIDGFDLFEREVVNPFCAQYCGGLTPNPCVICNPTVKFNLLCRFADSVGARYVATGHYARTQRFGGTVLIKKAACAPRDQSYMLYRLPQTVIERLVFPLGELTKDRVREIAAKGGLSAADMPDSQENCFIPDNNYAKYICERGYTSKAGWFISPDGERVAKHNGVLNYTIGQRRGLGLSFGKPVFVKRILQNGDIELGYSGDEFCTHISLSDCVFCAAYPDFDDNSLTVKIRSAAQAVPCYVERDGEKAAVRFASPVRAAAPGQSAVLYSGDILLGGGFIVDFS